MASIPSLALHVGDRKCLGTQAPRQAPGLKGQRGVNIEGLAVKDGRLYFGFRGPAEDGVAEILAIDANALFTGGDAKTTVANIVVGAGRGIRDLTAVKDGFLILAGPDDDNKDVGWAIAEWDGKGNADVATPKFLAQLDLRDLVRPSCDEEIKTEAMAVLDDAPDHFKVLILSDGMCDGGPVTFRVSR
jgi:Protein of unknown function (DUF3616)